MGIYVFSMHYNSKESVKETIGERTVEIAENMINFIDVEQYKELAENPVEDELYWELRDQLNELREINGVLYAYTYAVPKEGEDVTFLVDGMPADDTENAAALGETSGSTTYEHLQNVLNDGFYYSDLLSSDFGEYISGTIPMKDANGEVVAFLGVDIDASYVDEVSSNVASNIVPKVSIGFLIIVIIGLYLTYRYLNNSLRPLQVLKMASEQLADGDLKGVNESLSSLELKNRNEIALFVQTFSKALHSLTNSLSNLHTKSKNLEHAVTDIERAAVGVGESNQIIVSSIIDIASSSEEQEASNNEVTQAMTEMSAGIQRLADTTSGMAEASSDMNNLVEISVDDAKNVVSQIQNVENSVLHTEEYVREMGEKFKSIREMVMVITNIADQTNLLALNAAIEAARAGEAGKGFAVVADEVRKLAEMSRSSANEIQSYLDNFLLISDKALEEMRKSSEEVKVGTRAVMDIGDKLHQILTVVEDVNAKIQDDSAVIEQMSASSEEILAQTEAMNKLVMDTTGQTNEVASSSDVQVEMVHQLEEVVKLLDATSKEMIEEINKFKY
ncbi:methyl-accepting chemotaxis protein [Lysinibacillus yapensis]|uniref:Methyl-accepting chemotaxis protein n=2 Tax=Ureibacillus yapensis TaxID=2304605 RepID=A0A396SC41_9BACL|nr:methyl-accepting chemotaxis protein [Lysinibacillus yapensis]